MNKLIDRYLDGDLTDEEAAAFLDSLAGDPALEAELRTYERILSAGATPEGEGPSIGFTERVMEQVQGAPSPVRRWPGFPKRNALRWGLAWAAAAVLAFSVGRFTAGNRVAPPPEATLAPLEAASTAGDRTGLRLVRLVYVPSDAGVGEVAVAGTFNQWNPARTQMQREGSVWTTQLLLPRDTYEYMFVVDGNEWVTDPLAMETRDDGFGRENAVLDLTL